VWFPADWASRLSSFNSVTTFAYLLLLLNEAPAVAFTSSSFSSWAPQGVLVSLADRKKALYHMLSPHLPVYNQVLG
jgi:hypothetical protein